MITLDQEMFISCCKSAFFNMQQFQIDGLSFLINKLMKSRRIDTPAKSAYVLATVKWETADTFRPVTEYGSQIYLQSKKYYPYIGRGYVQLTWRDNYNKFGKALGHDLINFPGLANQPEIAWQILEIGMTDNFGIKDPDFTQYTLEDFLNNEITDFINARKIINPKDYNSYNPIADSAIKFLEIIRRCIITPSNIPEIRL